VAKHPNSPRTSPRWRRAAVVAAALPLTATFLGGTAGAVQTSPGSTALAGSQPLWATSATDRGATPAGSQIDLRVYLAGSNPAGLAAYARAVSDPSSAEYGHYLTTAQTQARFGATKAQISAVESWLGSSGLKVTGVTEHYVSVHGTVAQAGAAFGTSFHQYRVSGNTTKRAPNAAAKVPSTVASAVLGVTGLSDESFSTKPDNVPAASDGPEIESTNDGVPYLTATPCSNDYQGQAVATDLPSAYGSKVSWAVCGYTPKQVRSAYGVTSTGLTGKGVTVAIVDAYGLPTMLSDANEYATRHGDAPFKPGQYQQIVTPSLWTDQAQCGDWSGEEALDVESVHGTAPDANVLYVGGNSCFDTSGGGAAPNGGLLDSLALIVDNHLADMVSNSWGELMYGLDANGNVVGMDPALIAAYEQVFEQGAVEGIGFYFSAGDCGADDPNTGCGASEGSPFAQTEYPTSDPWVTSVGGTSIAIGKRGNYEWETSWQSASSALTTDRSAWAGLPGSWFYGGGGGTSQVFPQPWYQKGVVPTSLSNHLLSGAGTSPMRVNPDVAAYGDPSTGFLEGYTQLLPDGTTTAYAELRIGGTSLSCPTFAGIQADAQQAHHGQPIGFANPEIYLRGQHNLFRDVTDTPFGPNVMLAVVRNGDTNPAIRTMGQGDLQHATAGFDDATGLGTPNAGYLRSFMRPFFGG
jgi:subtilase family serine protease